MITGVSVQGLFGAFNHDVELNVDAGVTILSAPNGYGKSTLLRMIRSVGDGAWEELAQVPFLTLRICDDHGPAIVFAREITAEDRGIPEREAEFQLLFEQEMVRSWSDADELDSSPYFSRIKLTARQEGAGGKASTIGVFSATASTCIWPTHRTSRPACDMQRQGRSTTTGGRFAMLIGHTSGPRPRIVLGRRSCLAGCKAACRKSRCS